MKDKLQYPTIAIQLVNPQGMPYDMPDDWMETVVSIAAMINTKYKIGERRKKRTRKIGRRKSNCVCKHTGFCKKWLSHSNEH